MAVRVAPAEVAAEGTAEAVAVVTVAATAQDATSRRRKEPWSAFADLDCALTFARKTTLADPEVAGFGIIS